MTTNQKIGDYAGRLTAGAVMTALCEKLLDTKETDQQISQVAELAGQQPLFRQICNAAPKVRSILLQLNYKALEAPGRTIEQRVQDAVEVVNHLLSDDDKNAIMETLHQQAHHEN